MTIARVAFPNGESFTASYDGDDHEAERKIKISAIQLGMMNNQPTIAWTRDITAGLPAETIAVFFGKDGELQRKH